MAFYKLRHLIYILPALIIVGGFFILQLKYNIIPTRSDDSTRISLPYFKKEAKQEEAKKITEPHLIINEKIIKLEIADTPLKKIQGLSDRHAICADCGMLFTFKDKQTRKFWMKNMNFSIDIVWIEDDKIVNISSELAPEGEYPEKRYSSSVSVNYVLEVNAGYADKHGLRVGDIVLLNL